MTMQERAVRPTNSLLQDAASVLPGAVASVNRLVAEPVYFTEARGAELTDHAGKVYIDYNCAFGATILGHGDEELADVVARTSVKAISALSPIDCVVTVTTC